MAASPAGTVTAYYALPHNERLCPGRSNTGAKARNVAIAMFYLPFFWRFKPMQFCIDKLGRHL